MPDPTFLTPDCSQIELRLCPRKTIMGWFLMCILVFVTCSMIWSTICLLRVENLANPAMYFFLLINLLIPIIFLSVFLTDDRVTLTREGLTYRRKGFTTKERFFELSSIVGFEQVWKVSGKNNHYVIQINLKDQKPMEISNSQWISKKKQQIFIDECEEFLRRQKQTTWEETHAEEKASDDPMEVIHLKTDRLIFVDQPTDSEWTRDEEASEFTIYKNGKFSLGNFLGALGICAFWNGIVSVFVLHLFGVFPDGPKNGFEWWFQFLFLIPFEVIGLALFVNVFSTLFAAWGMEKWIFTRNEIRHETKSLGIRWTKRFDVSRTEKLEIKPVGLFFVSDGGEAEEETLCEIPLWSQAEARWLAARFQQMRSGW